MYYYTMSSKKLFSLTRSENLATLYTIAIAFIILDKIAFLSISLALAVRKVAHQPHNEVSTRLHYWRDVTELIFIISMSIILIYAFYPRWSKPVELTSETKYLLFFYGIITIITADWDVGSP